MKSSPKGHSWLLRYEGQSLFRCDRCGLYTYNVDEGDSFEIGIDSVTTNLSCNEVIARQVQDA